MELFNATNRQLGKGDKAAMAEVAKERAATLANGGSR